MSGIYQIYNPINNKRYIGSSINVERRLKEHLRNLEKNRHCNDHLQSAYNKYKDVLQFQFLEEMDAVLNLIPWGVGKGIKKLKSKVGRIIEGTEVDGASVHSFAPTQTKKKTRKKTEEDYDSEFSEVLRKDRNSKLID